MATTTEPTTNQKVLLCRLRRHVITDSDFVPAGTPVQVLGWTGNDEDGPGAKDASRVEVRAAAYMYAETFSYSARTTAVGVGLCLSVHPSNLEFLSIADA